MQIIATLFEALSMGTTTNLLWRSERDLRTSSSLSTGLTMPGTPRVFKILIRFSTKSKILDFHDKKDASERSYLVARLEMEDVIEDSIDF